MSRVLRAPYGNQGPGSQDPHAPRSLRTPRRSPLPPRTRSSSMTPIVQLRSPEPPNTTENKPIPAPQGESSPANIVGGGRLHGGPPHSAGRVEPRAEPPY